MTGLLRQRVLPATFEGCCHNQGCPRTKKDRTGTCAKIDVLQPAGVLVFSMQGHSQSRSWRWVRPSTAEVTLQFAEDTRSLLRQARPHAPRVTAGRSNSGAACLTSSRSGTETPWSRNWPNSQACLGGLRLCRSQERLDLAGHVTQSHARRKKAFLGHSKQAGPALFKASFKNWTPSTVAHDGELGGEIKEALREKLMRRAAAAVLSAPLRTAAEDSAKCFKEDRIAHRGKEPSSWVKAMHGQTQSRYEAQARSQACSSHQASRRRRGVHAAAKGPRRVCQIARGISGNWKRSLMIQANDSSRACGQLQQKAWGPGIAASGGF